MKLSTLVEKISNGEDSYTQFKETIIRPQSLAKEMVAFANSEGGIIIFGVADNKDIKGLNDEQLEKIRQLVANVANENIRPPIYPLMEIVTLNGLTLIVITIAKGANKPYSTSSGEYYIKSGSEKKIISTEALKRLFFQSNVHYADEEILLNTSIKDLNTELFYQFLEKEDLRIYEELQNDLLSLTTVLENRELLRDEHLTLSGNLIFGKNPQRFNKSFYIDCVYFNGNDITTNSFISKEVIKGTFGELYKQSLYFLKSHLIKKQVEADFNTLGELEINEIILSEIMVNALVHRDYYINSSIKVFIFENRIEIISPGKLTNSLTVEKIKSGISIHRNPILNSISKYVLPYSGYGSGIKRVLKLNSEIEFINDVENEIFKVIINRK
ncbi:MAG: ATP-dependent DNA helicase [Methylococcaceae bacterium]|nr:ATP-dependent DNA helicase [Methylococcaceae bacterium]